MKEYYSMNELMTIPEQNLYKQLSEYISNNNLNYEIHPQVRLEDIVKSIDKSYKYRNKISSKSIDYTIIDKNTFKIFCCIELDDNTHNYANRIERDTFINNLFHEVNIPLHRIKGIKKNYQKEIECIFKGDFIMDKFKIIVTDDRKDFEIKIAENLEKGYKMKISNISVTNYNYKTERTAKLEKNKYKEIMFYAYMEKED